MEVNKKLKWRGNHEEIFAGVTGTGVYLYKPLLRRYKKITWN